MPTVLSMRPKKCGSFALKLRYPYPIEELLQKNPGYEPFVGDLSKIFASYELVDIIYLCFFDTKFTRKKLYAYCTGYIFRHTSVIPVPSVKCVPWYAP